MINEDLKDLRRLYYHLERSQYILDTMTDLDIAPEYYTAEDRNILAMLDSYYNEVVQMKTWIGDFLKDKVS